MIEQTLSILEDLVREKPTKEKRSTDLLKNPIVEGTEEWYMCVPSCFNEALDVKRTERVEDKKKSLVWTQGSAFSFKQGDILYDTADAYKVWSEALKNINLCVQINTASSAQPSQGEFGRFSGSVSFSILAPDKDRSKIVECAEHTMSQDDFVRFLIVGPGDDLKNKIRRPQE